VTLFFFSVFFFTVGGKFRNACRSLGRLQVSLLRFDECLPFRCAFGALPFGSESCACASACSVP
jgi:hypothetical protein